MIIIIGIIKTSCYNIQTLKYIAIKNYIFYCSIVTSADLHTI